MNVKYQLENYRVTLVVWILGKFRMFHQLFNQTKEHDHQSHPAEIGYRW